MGRIKDNFDDKGFVVVKSLVSKKMIFKIFQQVEQLIDEALKIKKVNPSEFENVDTKYMFLKKNFPKIKSHIYDLIKYLDGVHAISTMPSLLEIIKELSGPSLLLDGIQLGINDFDLKTRFSGILEILEMNYLSIQEKSFPERGKPV